MPFPEIPGQTLDAGVEHVGVFDGLVAVIVLGVHAHDRGLDAQIDVLGHQRDPRLRHLPLQRESLSKYQIVGADAREAFRQAAGEFTRLEEQPPGGWSLTVVAAVARRDDQARIDLLLGDAAHYVIEKAADLTSVARGFR